MKYLNFCKTCHYSWESRTEEKFCPRCLTEDVVHDREPEDHKAGLLLKFQDEEI